MKRQVWLFIVIGIVLVGIMSACSSDTPAGSGKEGDTSKKEVQTEGENVSLKMLVSRSPVHADYSDMLVWKEYEKISGVHIEWELVPDTNFVEKRNILLASGDYPDAIYRAQLNNSDIAARGSDGIFISLNDLIEEHAPNLVKLFEKYPEVKAGITQADGNIYSLPFVSDFQSANYGAKLFLNKKWMDRIGADEPTTTDELYQLLKDFKEQDANGNGQNDEIPITGTEIASIENALKGFWGLGNRGGAHPMVDIDESTNDLRFIPTADQYKEVLEYLAKLYNEGLIDKEIFTMDTSKLTAKGEDDTVGAFIFANPVPIGQKTKDDYIGLQALKGPHGDQLISSLNPVLRNSGAFVITNVNKYPEETMEWVDYWYSEEGMKLFFMGKEGETFTKVGEDEYQYVDDIVSNPQGLTLDEAVGKYLAWPGAGQPTVQTEKFSKGGASYPSAIDATSKVSDYFPNEIWPQFTYTQEESDLLASTGNDLTTYVDEMKVKFITGETPFTEWNKYVDTLNKMGLDDYMDVYNQAFERFSKLNNE
ncbi:ABC transporter substrate-binding protein [Bacillus sp. J14TS2]|uniref:extracellular solute-binding protein n=1 Tax=Bacillus sp. J14TS2 TaxID=2807188 RepID=UPI001B216D26|nr:extracellular solute-binding protein [Bacillus sp. J14TS2]GIN73955.1 ABC transporter substrate-binding protein [Bacillus sp. J14TS2]